MNIDFKHFTYADVPLYFTWCDKPHVKEKWFRPSYEPKEQILQKIDGGQNGVMPFVIMMDGVPVGYIQSYRVGTSWEALQNEPEGTFGFDIFIGEEAYIGKGYGAQIVKAFAAKMFAMEGVARMIVDPFAEDKRAIRCYEKAEFVRVREDVDDKGSAIMIMERLNTPRELAAG